MQLLFFHLVQHVTMHHYDEDGSADDEDEDYDGDEFLAAPSEPSPTTVVLKPNSLEGLIGSGFKAGR